MPPSVRTTMKSALVLLAALLLAPPALARTARELNAEGLRLYQQGRLPEALERFRAAAQADPRHALAAYNVAATLGVLRKQGRVCEFEAYRSTIVEWLTRSVRLDARRLARAREDTDLDSIRDTLGWQRLRGLSPERVAHVPALLRKVSWYGPGVGVYGTTRALRFQEGGRVVLWRKVLDADGPPREEEVAGTWRVQGRTVRLRFPGQPPYEGTLTRRGLLEVEALGPFTDSPSECEA